MGDHWGTNVLSKHVSLENRRISGAEQRYTSADHGADRYQEREALDKKRSGASRSCIASGSWSRFALCPTNSSVLRAKECLKDLGIGNTLESLYLVRPTKRGTITSQRFRENAPRVGERTTWQLKKILYSQHVKNLCALKFPLPRHFSNSLIRLKNLLFFYNLGHKGWKFPFFPIFSLSTPVQCWQNTLI